VARTLFWVDADTVDIYERRAQEWIERRGETTDGLGLRLRQLAGPGPVVDLGCGAGRYLGELAAPVVGLDASGAMLDLARRSGQPLARADLEHLPFADGSLAGAFARHSYLHLEKARLVGALRDLRRALVAGGVLLMTVIEGSYEGHHLPTDDFAGRYFACYRAEELRRAILEAGFSGVVVDETPYPRPSTRRDLLATAFG
jgi:SAM-dependent methyltransferase